MSVYRLDRGHAAVMTGVLVIIAAALAFVGFLTSSRPVGVVAVVVVLAAVWVVARPPALVRLDKAGFRARGAHGTWDAVQNVKVENGHLVLDGGPGTSHRIILATLGRRAPELVREVYDRMNDSRGYQRWDPTA